VTNDRAQSGSALEEGSIQLMQNRRIFADDNYGVAEDLNEMDKVGNGMRVKATYFVEIINHKTGISH